MEQKIAIFDILSFSFDTNENKITLQGKIQTRQAQAAWQGHNTNNFYLEKHTHSFRGKT